MKGRFLFPHYCRWIGLLLAIPGFVLGYFNVYHEFFFKQLTFNEEQLQVVFGCGNLTDEIALALVVCGLMLIAFAKEKIEDELTARLRLDALYWAILINYLGFLLFEIVFFILAKADVYYHDSNLKVDGINSDYGIYNFFTPLLIFIFRFNYLLHYKKGNLVSPALRYLNYYPYRKIGEKGTWICLILIALLTWDVKFPTPIDVYIVLCYPLLFMFLLMWVYSRNPEEDELTMHFRLESMQLAVYVNCALLLIANFAFYGFDFLAVMLINLVSIPLFFVIRFTYVSNKAYWQARNEMKGGII